MAAEAVAYSIKTRPPPHVYPRHRGQIGYRLLARDCVALATEYTPTISAVPAVSRVLCTHTNTAAAVAPPILRDDSASRKEGGRGELYLKLPPRF